MFFFCLFLPFTPFLYFFPLHSPFKYLSGVNSLIRARQNRSFKYIYIYIYTLSKHAHSFTKPICLHCDLYIYIYNQLCSSMFQLIVTFIIIPGHCWKLLSFILWYILLIVKVLGKRARTNIYIYNIYICIYNKKDQQWGREGRVYMNHNKLCMDG